MHKIFLGSLLLALLAVSPSDAQTSNCNIRDFIVKDTTSIFQNDQSELSFVLTSSKEEFETAKKSGAIGGAYKLVSATADWGQSRERAMRIAEATKFDYKSSYALSYFQQNASPSALAAYESCLRAGKETPGMTLWFEKREGDFLTYKAFWVGKDIEDSTAADKSIVVDGGRIVAQPDAWIKARTEQIVVKRAGNNDVFLSVTAGGLSGSVVVVQDPPPVIWHTKQVLGRTMTVQSTSSNPCDPGQASDTIFVTMPGGSFVPGTAVLLNRSTTDSATYSEQLSEAPLNVTASISQYTRACERVQLATGQLSALERYPTASE